MNSILLALDELLNDDFFEMSILANSSAFINQNFENLNWVGFYILKENTLYLGPFQGKVACTKIEVGKGVCGTCVKEGLPQLVNDVHTFTGHIVCDDASNSEVVIPIFINGKTYGVLDIDSPLLNRFTNSDLDLFIKIGKIIEKHLAKLVSIS